MPFPFVSRSTYRAVEQEHQYARTQMENHAISLVNDCAQLKSELDRARNDLAWYRAENERLANDILLLMAQLPKTIH